MVCGGVWWCVVVIQKTITVVRCKINSYSSIETERGPGKHLGAKPKLRMVGRYGFLYSKQC